MLIIPKVNLLKVDNYADGLKIAAIYRVSMIFFNDISGRTSSSPLQICDGLWRACKVFNDNAFAWKSLGCWICCGSGYGHLWKGEGDIGSAHFDPSQNY